MPAKDLGTKYVCFKCGTRFYDLRKPVPACPKCGADQRESPAVKPPAPEKRRAPPRPPVAAPVVEEVEAEALEDLEEGEEPADEDVDEDAEP
ncbi:MAG TPA: FYDLN acid domain-containing protein [Anaeromyxobacteraceae bacterium]|nr:FYDLN acid domain-containing protein [Anaeromyxobacteraceae bacterium]